MAGVIRSTSLFLCALVYTQPTFAGGNLFCKITSVNEVAPHGELNRLSADNRTAFAKHVGTEFIIDRTTGLMLGKHVENENKTWETKVIDYGSGGQSYRAVSINRKHSPQQHGSGQYIEVRTWEEGERKPFVLIDPEIVLGYCTM